jgi:hypothetical protein
MSFALGLSELIRTNLRELGRDCSNYAQIPHREANEQDSAGLRYDPSSPSLLSARLLTGHSVKLTSVPRSRISYLIPIILIITIAILDNDSMVNVKSVEDGL